MFGDSTGNITVSVIGGSYPYTYNWSSTNLNSNIIDSIPAGLYELKQLIQIIVVYRFYIVNSTYPIINMIH